MNEQTAICAEIRPNYLVFCALYLILIIFAFKLVNLIVFKDYDWLATMCLLILFILLRSLIHFSIGRLRNRFERMMLVKPEE